MSYIDNEFDIYYYETKRVLPKIDNLNCSFTLDVNYKVFSCKAEAIGGKLVAVSVKHLSSFGGNSTICHAEWTKKKHMMPERADFHSFAAHSIEDFTVKGRTVPYLPDDGRVAGVFTAFMEAMELAEATLVYTAA